jgi:hypothetical protein
MWPIRLVLQALAPAFETARARLIEIGIREGRLEALGEAIRASVDPHLPYHVDRLRKRIHSNAFRTHLLPSCLEATAAEVNQALALRQELRLDARPELLAAVRALFTAAGPRDPLEALKLGTYVGSCLAPGGLCTYSAASVVLDVNKQVLYARDARRTVVGRQLVASSTQGELVCFSVYPRSASAAVKALFRDHDVAFAAALGVPLHRPAKEEGTAYKIELIVAQEWWDDGVFEDVKKKRARQRVA